VNHKFDILQQCPDHFNQSLFDLTIAAIAHQHSSNPEIPIKPRVPQSSASIQPPSCGSRRRAFGTRFHTQVGLSVCPPIILKPLPAAFYSHRKSHRGALVAGKSTYHRFNVSLVGSASASSVKPAFFNMSAEMFGVKGSSQRQNTPWLVFAKRYVFRGAAT
jgi:hypothetical protein